MSEHNLQTGCVTWFRLQYPKLADLLFAIPNGGLRNKVVAQKLKDEGVLPGVSDLLLAVPMHGYHGFFIEMKYGNNKLTKSQAEFLQNVSDFEYFTAVCYTFESFKAEIERYLEG